jgi:hypothetical protein
MTLSKTYVAQYDTSVTRMGLVVQSMLATQSCYSFRKLRV